MQNGRVHDVASAAQQTALRTIAQVHDGDFRITPNQNLDDCQCADGHSRPKSSASRARPDLLAPWSGLRRNSMACVALPTCGLALAESERYLPELVDALDQKLAAHGLSADDIVIRMTGCPNGCARPYLAEIGLVGKGPGRYNLYLGAAFDGSRMNKLYAEDLDHAGIVAALDPLFAAYVAGRQKSERFGDFVIRTSGASPRARHRRRISREFGQAKGGMSEPREPEGCAGAAAWVRSPGFLSFFRSTASARVVAGGSAPRQPGRRVLSAAGARVDASMRRTRASELAATGQPARRAAPVAINARPWLARGPEGAPRLRSAPSTTTRARPRLRRPRALPACRST